MKAYDLLDADESYIRASSVRMIGFIIANKTLRCTFQENHSVVSFLKIPFLVNLGKIKSRNLEK